MKVDRQGLGKANLRRKLQGLGVWLERPRGMNEEGRARTRRRVANKTSVIRQIRYKAGVESCQVCAVLILLERGAAAGPCVFKKP